MAIQYDPLQPVTPVDYKPPVVKNPEAILGPTKGAVDYINPKTDTVEGRVEGLLSKGGDINKQTQQTALNIGNSRGLLNSTGTAKAGTSALIGRAIDIATPDAAAYSSFGKNNQLTENQGLLNNQTAALQSQQADNAGRITGALNSQTQGGQQQLAILSGKIQSGLTDQEWKVARDLAEQQGKITGTLEEQRAEIARRLAQMQGEISGGLIEKQGDVSARLAEQQGQIYQNLAEQKGQIAKDYKEFSIVFDKELAQMGIDAAERQNIANSMSQQTVTMMNNMGTLLNNPDIVMGDNVPTWMNDYMYESWQTTASLYGLEIEVV